MIRRELTRRRILTAGIGAAQLALLSAWSLRPRRAHAKLGEDGRPSRLLSIYVDGGWMPEYFFTPLSNDQIVQSVLEPRTYRGEKIFFEPSDVANLDGTGDAPDADDERFLRLRAPAHWDADALRATGVDPGPGTTPDGWAWVHDDLFQRGTMVHGIDVQTAAHLSGQISMMSGVATPKFEQPALAAIVADAASRAFPERPLQSVNVSGLSPQSVFLGSAAAPTAIRNTSSLEETLSERSRVAWEGLRDRSEHPARAFNGPRLDGFDQLNPIDALTLDETRRMSGRTTPATDHFYEQFYETYRSVSNTFAQDLVTVLEQTPGWENFDPTWRQLGTQPPYGVRYGLADGGDTGSTWATPIDLALRLFKADLCSSVSVRFWGTENQGFDTHSMPGGHGYQFLENRVIFEIVGRLLHEMAATPISMGRSLLDDTLVVVYSDFSRTWSRRGGVNGGSDHWPTTSALLAGGGVRGNRQIGNFEFSEGSNSPLGREVELRDEDGESVTRVPLSRDYVYTALQTMGITDFFMPGGPGEILGVRE